MVRSIREIIYDLNFLNLRSYRLPKLKEWIDANDPGATMIPFSGAFEGKVAEMESEARKAFMEEHKVSSALDKIIVQGYKALHLMYFFTAGPDEVKAWAIQVYWLPLRSFCCFERFS